MPRRLSGWRGMPVNGQGAARTLHQRTRPHPLAIALLAMTTLLLVILAVWAILNGRAPPH